MFAENGTCQKGNEVIGLVLLVLSKEFLCQFCITNNFQDFFKIRLDAFEVALPLEADITSCIIRPIPRYYVLKFIVHYFTSAPILRC